MSISRRTIAASLITLGLMCVTPPASAYSVLSHEANIDALWDSSIKPLLRQRFPLASPDDLQRARAFAYGGSVIQDLGYYPFGNHFFSNLVHYVRTGDFVQALIHDAGDLEEYAFALGALAHYAADNLGHPVAVNRAVPMMYPKLKQKYGDTVTYAESPKSHILVEFSFDVLQVAAGSYAPEAYHDFIGFEVSKQLLDRAFFETYGLKMKDVFFDEDLTIGTYRYAVSQAIPQMTNVAWRQKHDLIDKAAPGATRQQFVFNLKRQDYEKQFGARYQKPNVLIRVLAFLYRLVPKFGPFRVLTFKPPTAEAEKLFVDSFQQARNRFHQSLDALAAGHLTLPNTDFDTGKPTMRGEYALADETYDTLLDKLADRKFADVPDALRANMVGYYNALAPAAPAQGRKARKRAERTRREVVALNAGSTTSPGR